MSKPIKIVGLCGSLRTHSYSGMLLNALFDLLPEGVTVQSVDIAAIPHYNQDFDTPEGPEAVLDGRKLIANADAVILTLPEFNHGVPGVLKNALDWLSRPAFNSCFAGKPVMFATIAPGALGGVRAQYQMRETLASMLCNLTPLPEIAVTLAGQKFTDGKLTDEATANHLKMVMDTFLKANELI
ncbi:NAD(P)H-dependent oxidoreductase [uncultured Cohaesibacter sp.]|uniref:NADPH-dependent FMN reductase n=1 Tax=uncultured Cohaesibacter sp. TaxID=1002546 RepID=UPI0029C98141|nr:NAD(P)H-dependent oxidoreductase [uncultured Cohaesibacter sp.]